MKGQSLPKQKAMIFSSSKTHSVTLTAEEKLGKAAMGGAEPGNRKKKLVSDQTNQVQKDEHEDI